MPDPAGGAVAYRLVHETEYRYETPADNAWQLAHLEPRACAWQSVDAHRVDIEPAPDERGASTDFFGNPVLRFALTRPHTQLLVRASSRVTVRARAPAPGADSPPWERVARAFDDGDPALRFELAQFLVASPQVPTLPTGARVARTEFVPGRPWLDALVGLARHIHRDFEFDPVATTVSTPVTAVIDARRGVCQDFAHLMICCLRSIGLPARYVSGYILTTPRPGQPRLAGADASHAWVSAWCPGLGWVDCDPTNGKLADTEFVTLAWGREYADVTPLRGVVRGGGRQRLDVRVTLEPAP